MSSGHILSLCLAFWDCLDKEDLCSNFPSCGFAGVPRALRFESGVEASQFLTAQVTQNHETAMMDALGNLLVLGILRLLMDVLSCLCPRSVTYLFILVLQRKEHGI